MTTELTIYRDGNEFLTHPINDQTIFAHKISGEHKITAVFDSEAPLGIHIGDYIEYDGFVFEINQPVTEEKTSRFSYKTTATFESFQYRLYNKVFMHQGAIEFAYLGTAAEYMALIVSNMNSIDSNWSIGHVDTTEPLYISFFAGAEGYSCRTALTEIATRFGLEFWITADAYGGKTLNLAKMAGRVTNYDFEVGRSKGLYSLTRRPLDDMKIINRIYPFGSTRNIPAGYRSGAQRLCIGGGYIERPLEAGEIRREGSIIIDDIYPNRTAAIQSVGVDGLSFTDSTLFDINGQAIEGVQASVVIQSGALMGEEFVIDSYDHDTHTITIQPLTLANGRVIPDETFAISPGDTYSLIGIELPNSYIEQAEAKLIARANEILSQPNNPVYDLFMDEKYIRDNIVVLKAGDRINVRDSAMGVDAVIRVSGIQYPLVRPERITAEVSDVIPYSVVERVVVENSQSLRVVVTSDRVNAEKARRNMLNQRRLQESIYDPDGYFDPTNIRHRSVETLFLAVGAVSQNYGLNGVVIDVNSGGNANTTTISAGQLIHYEIQREGGGYVWNIPARTFAGLDPLKLYYMYARCSRGTDNGTWELSDTPVMTDDPTYPLSWNFNLGVIYPVQDGRRDYDLTKGMTMIVGDTITTGRIRSLDTINYFDLTQNKFNLGGSSAGIDWNVTTANTLTIRGGIVQNPGGASAHVPLPRGTWQPGVTYYPGDWVTYNGASYRYIGATALPTTAPPSALWELIAAKGADGTNGADGANGDYVELRFQQTGSGTVPPTVDVDDPEPAGWDLQEPNYDPLQYIWSISALKSGADGSLITEWPAVPRLWQGAQGPQGVPGASIVFRGTFDIGETYYGREDRIDIVYYMGMYYRTRTDIPGGEVTGELPTDDDYWNEFGAQFDSVATGLILAQYGVIQNLGAQYIRTDIEGEKRVEINERREKKEADGTGTGVFVNQNNIALFNSNDEKLIEMDDDSSPGIGVFYLEFPDTNDPGLAQLPGIPAYGRFEGDLRERDWSQYNTGSIDSRTGLAGDFTNGFPRFVMKLVKQSMPNRVRYYFRNPTAGFNAGDPNNDTSIFLPHTSIGAEISNINNVNVWGTFGTGGTKILDTYPFDNNLDDDTTVFIQGPDNTVIYKGGSGTVYFNMPFFLLGSSGSYTINHNALRYTQIGREITFCNYGLGDIIIQGSGASDINMFLDGTWTDTNAIDVYSSQWVKIKLISKNGSPNSFAQWRWMVVQRGELN